MLAATGASTKGLGPPVLDMAAGNPVASCKQGVSRSTLACPVLCLGGCRTMPLMSSGVADDPD